MWDTDITQRYKIMYKKGDNIFLENNIYERGLAESLPGEVDYKWGKLSLQDSNWTGTFE